MKNPNGPSIEEVDDWNDALADQEAERRSGAAHGSGAYLLPPKPDVCQSCAVKHAPEQPHNQQSLYWQYWFYGQHQRWPKWEDAMAHCTPEVQQFWVTQLAKHKIVVKLPNAKLNDAAR